MAAKTTVRVAITNNAAKDDSYSGAGLDWLGENGSLTGSLNVLGNDPGSATLYAVHSGLPTASGQMAPANTSSFTVVHDGHSYTGTLKINADGTLGFDLSSLAGSLDSLADGETLDITIYYTAKMANGVLSTAKVSISLTGSNDAPVATAETVNVFEDGALATGHVDATDIDHGATLSYALISTAPAGFTFNPDGSYSFDPANSAYQHLAAGVDDVIVLTYEVTDEHGEAAQNTITLTITGVNDPASISGDSDGAVSEDDVTSDSGVLSVSDVDDNEAHTDDGVQSGAYGDFTVDADGNWSYDLDHDLANSLQGGEEKTETFTVASLDGTASQDVTITVTGTNDAAAITGDASGAVSEDNVTSDSGTLTVSDADHDESHSEAGSQSGAYGAFTVDADGNWSYDLDHDLANSLRGGEEKTETFTVASLDGTASQDVTITVTGTNDAAAIGGTASGDAYEDGVTTASGALTVSDDDHDESSFQTQTGTSGDYGSFSIDSLGNWSYTLDSRADGLNDSDVLTETFAVASADGTTASVTVTVHGHTDVTAPVLAPVQTYDPNNQDPNNNDGTTSASLNGGSAANTLYGGPGDDVINGQNGNDTLYGGSGNDTLHGQNDNDSLYGGDGSDALNGTNNTDVLIGGYGADALSGGNAGDVFKFLYALDRGDTISDFDRTQGDTINVTDLHFTGGFQASATSHGLWQVGSHVYGDTDGNVNTIEFYFDVNTALQASDFTL